MVKKDYYKILDVDRDASSDEIKKSFKKLARKYHPDIAGKGSEEKFKEINEAFQILGNSQKKEQYDKFGNSDFDSENFSNKSSNFKDIFRSFGDMFGAFDSDRNSNEGVDLKYDLEITLEDSFNGIKKKVEVPRFTRCLKCDGTGAKNGHLKKCSNCDGNGEVHRIQQSIFGQMISVTICNDCSGRGNIIIEKCEKCDGNSIIKETKKIEIEIPKGVESGQYLRLNGEGDTGENGGHKGDLYVIITVSEHEIFERRDNDLFCKTSIDLSTAIFGDEIEVPTMKEKIKLKIPKGTQSHTIFRLKNKGMPHVNSNRKGDQLIKVIVKIPKNISKDELISIGKKKSETKKGFFETLMKNFE